MSEKNGLLAVEWYFLLLGVFSIPLFESPKTVFLILAGLFHVIRRVRAGALGAELSRADVRMGFLALWLASVVSGLFAEHPSLAITAGSENFLMMYILFIVAADFSARGDRKTISLVVILSTAIAGLWGFAEYFSGRKQYLELNSVGFTNHSAIYLGLALLVGFYYASAHFKGSRPVEKLAVLIGVPVIAAALCLSSTGETLLGSGRFLFFFFILFFLDNRRLRLLAGICLVLVAAALIAVFHKDFSIWGIHQRLEIWGLSLEIFKRHFLTGIGAKHFSLVNLSEYGLSETASRYLSPLTHPHSLYFSIIVQYGIIGLGSAFLLSCLIFKSILRAGKSIRPLLGCAFAAVLAVGCVNTTLIAEHGLLFALIAAFAAGGNSESRPSSG